MSSSEYGLHTSSGRLCSYDIEFDTHSLVHYNMHVHDIPLGMAEFCESISTMRNVARRLVAYDVA